MKKKGRGTIFIAEQDWEATFYRTKKKKIVMYVIYVIPDISNRVLDFFWELPHTIWLKHEKLVLVAHFPLYLWFYWTDYFQKQKDSPMSGPAPTMWISWKSVQNWDLYRNYTYTVYIYISSFMWNEKTTLRSDSKIPGKLPYILEGNFEGIYSICWL